MGVGLRVHLQHSIVNHIICAYNLSYYIFFWFLAFRQTFCQIYPELKRPGERAGGGIDIQLYCNVDIVLWAGTKIYIL
jgi:hypothetical protein